MAKCESSRLEMPRDEMLFSLEAKNPGRLAIAQGLARLVDGQCAFAEEFGLSLARVFSDGFESFKGRDAADVIAGWTRGDEVDARKIDALFDDLIGHQLALVKALEAAASEQRNPPGACVSAGLLGRLRRVHNFFFKVRRHKGECDGSARYLRDVAPAFVVAYVQSREQYAESLFSGCGQ